MARSRLYQLRSHAALFTAVQEGNLSKVALLASTENINATFNGDTPLHVAAKLGHTDIIKFLVEKGANVNAVNPTGGMIFASASSNSPFKNTDQREENNIGQTPLHAALEVNDIPRPALLEIVRLLLEKGADVNAQNGDTYPPLYLTIFPGHDDIANLLLEHGADPVAYNIRYGTLLHEAAARGRIEIMELLITHGAKIDADKGRHGDTETPLHIAVRREQPEAVRYLLAKGASTEILNSDQKTPLQLTKHESFDAWLKDVTPSSLFSCRIL